MRSILGALFEKIILPELMAFIRARVAQTGQVPTDDAVIAKLNADADLVIAKGEAFLASAPPVLRLRTFSIEGIPLVVPDGVEGATEDEIQKLTDRVLAGLLSLDDLDVGAALAALRLPDPAGG